MLLTLLQGCKDIVSRGLSKEPPPLGVKWSQRTGVPTTSKPPFKSPNTTSKRSLSEESKPCDERIVVLRLDDILAHNRREGSFFDPLESSFEGLSKGELYEQLEKHIVKFDNPMSPSFVVSGSNKSDPSKEEANDKGISKECKRQLVKVPGPHSLSLGNSRRIPWKEEDSVKPRSPHEVPSIGKGDVCKKGINVEHVEGLARPRKCKELKAILSKEGGHDAYCQYDHPQERPIQKGSKPNAMKLPITEDDHQLKKTLHVLLKVLIQRHKPHGVFPRQKGQRTSQSNQETKPDQNGKLGLLRSSRHSPRRNKLMQLLAGYHSPFLRSKLLA